jgi:peroxiredoxin
MLNRRLFGPLVWMCLAAGLAHAADVPRPAGELTINTTDGKGILLSQYKGKVCAVAFILTYCPHCQKTVGFLTTMQNEYGPQGFQVLASAIDPMANMKVADFIKSFHPSFPVGFNERDPVLEFLQHPAMFKLMMPQLVFIDRKGAIRAQYAGDDKFFKDEDQEKNIRDEIDTLLKEGSAAHKKRAASPATKKTS